LAFEVNERIANLSMNLLQSLPRVAHATRSVRSNMPELPERTALYRLLDHSRNLLYVGISNDPEERFASHRREKAWWPQVDGISIEWFESRRAASLAEAHTIATENPRHNIHQTDAWREQQRVTALALSHEAGRNRSIGRKARTAQVRTYEALRAQGVPEAEATERARLAREEYIAARRRHFSENPDAGLARCDAGHVTTCSACTDPEAVLSP
jgi:excinuclease UvrABC nuclease subunit